MLLRGCVSASVSVCPSPPFHPLPHPSPNLESDVAPSYSTFPCVSSWSRQSPGSLLGEAALPGEYRAPGGAGRDWTQSLPAPSCPHWEGRAATTSGGLVRGSPSPSDLPTPQFSAPFEAVVPGWDRILDQGRLPGLSPPTPTPTPRWLPLHFSALVPRTLSKA